MESQNLFISPKVLEELSDSNGNWIPEKVQMTITILLWTVSRPAVCASVLTKWRLLCVFGEYAIVISSSESYC